MKQISLGKILITPQGEYDSLKTYQYLDVVSHDGASYMAKTDVPEGSSLTNTTYWLQIAAKGSNADIATITSAVNTWLAAHVTQPTTPAIDDTLSITGAAADAAKTGLMIAPIYSNTTTYNLGDIVNYNGSLYRCISTITTAEDWNNNHWITTKMADEVGDLKSANNYVIKTEFSDTFETVPFNASGGFVKGRINTTTGANASSTTRARRYNSILSGNYVSLGTNDYEYTLLYYDGVGSSWTDTYTHVYSDWITGSTWTLIDESIGDRARVVVRHPDDSEISNTDLDILTRSCLTRDLKQIVPQITTKKGNPVYIGELEALARDWYSHRNDIVSGSKAMVYGNNSILNTSSYTREIDCSTFVGILLRGYSFSQTPYATGQGASPDSWTGNTSYNWTFNPFDYSNYSRIDSQSKTKVRYASQMAEMMIERGQTVPIDRYYANIESGDVLFFARQDETTNDWFEPLRFKHINHVAICIAKEKATSADGWDVSTYPWKHTFAEVGHEDETTPDGVIKIRILEQPQGDTSAIFENNINTLCLVCRPDFGSISDGYTELNEEVDNLRSAFEADLVSTDWTPNITQGSYFKTSNGAAASSSSNTYARTSVLWEGYGTRKAIIVDDPTYEFCLAFYDETGTTSGTGYIGYDGYATGMHYIPKNAVLFGISFRRVNQAALTDSDITAISAALSALAATDTTLSVAGAPADAKATGDMFNTAIIEKDSLPANTDLNTFTTIGLYRIPSGNSVIPTLINYPSSNPGRLLVLSNEAGNFCTQVVITSTNTIFIRVQTSISNHTWTEWASYDGTVVRTRVATKNENDRYDADLTLTNGVYSISPATASNFDHLPSEYSGVLLVFGGDASRVQIYINRYGTVYYRFKYWANAFGEWYRPLKPDTTLSLAGAAADAKVTGDKINEILIETDNLFDGNSISENIFDKENNVVYGTADALNGTILVSGLSEGGIFNFDFDYKNSGNITSTIGPAIQGEDGNGNPVNVIAVSNGATREFIPISNFKEYLHRSFAYIFPSNTATIKIIKYENPSASAIFSMRNLKITKLSSSGLYKYQDYYPHKSSCDYIARNEAKRAGYVHDGKILRMENNPDAIPVGENHYGYNEFIQNTWDTLLPDGYMDGDQYNANTTKIHGVKVERESNWQSTPYGANTDVYTIYRYIFTPQNGYEKTLFLTSGCHGNEAEAYWGLYRIVKMIYFEGYKYPTLRNLRNCRLIIIPCWNPWGLQHYRRYNAFSALNTGSTDVAKNYQAWEWLRAPNHQVTVNGTIYDISQVGEANVIWQTLQKYGDAINLWIDFHTDPYAGRNTSNVDIDDPRGYTPPYGCYGFSADNSKGYFRLFDVMDDFYNILKNEYNFTETWHPQSTNTNGGSLTGWMAQYPFASGVVEISTFMNNFPYASGSAGMMKLAQEYYANCITEMLR